jgi:hypothetical protein
MILGYSDLGHNRTELKTHGFGSFQNLVYIGGDYVSMDEFLLSAGNKIVNNFFAESDPHLQLVRCVQSMKRVPGYGIHNIPPNQKARRLEASVNCVNPEAVGGTFKRVPMWGLLVDPYDVACAVHYVFTNTDLMKNDVRRLILRDFFHRMKIVSCAWAADNPFDERMYQVIMVLPKSPKPA